MSRFPNGVVKFLFSVSLVVLLATAGATAQSLISQSNPAQPGQQVAYTVVGSTSPVCLILAQVDTSGNLLTLSSYYIAALATYQITSPSLAGTSTTTIFAISEPVGANRATACQSIPTAYLSDLTRAPRIFETIVTTQGQTVSSPIECLPRIIQGEGGLIRLGVIQPPSSQSSDTSTFQFELLPFQPAGGSAFASLLSRCGSPSVNQAGASGYVACAYPNTGGSLLNPTFH